MKTFFLKLLGFEFVQNKSGLGKIHAIGCGQANKIRNKKYLTFKDVEKTSTSDHCEYCSSTIFNMFFP